MRPDAKQYMIDGRLEQSAESILEARALLEKDFYRGSINRAYYAMFYAVQALMIHKEIRASKHSGAISTFDLEFIKPGILKQDYSKWLHDAFELRMEVDYADFVLPDREQSVQTLNNAKKFVEAIKDYLASQRTT